MGRRRLKYKGVSALLAALIFIVIIRPHDEVILAYSQPIFAPVRRVYEGFEVGLGVFQAEPSASPNIKITSEYKHSGNHSVLVNSTSDVASVMTTFQGMKTYFRVEFFVYPISRASEGNLPIAQVTMLSTSSTTISLWLSDSGLVSLVDGVNRTQQKVPLKFNEWANVSLVYDPHDGVLSVNLGSSRVAYVALPRAPETGVEVVLGIFDLSGSHGGALAYDDVSLYISPLILVDPPIANLGDTVRISGLHFTPNGLVSFDVTSETGVVSSWDDIRANYTGGFSIYLKLEGMSIGLLNLVAKDMESGSEVTYHLGVWGLSDVEIRKVRAFYVLGAGLMPNSQLRIVLTSGDFRLQEMLISADEGGNFRSPSVSIPAGAPSGVYKIRIEGASSYDFKDRSFDESLEFVPKSALINVEATVDSDVYGRLQELRVTVKARYENGSLIAYNPNSEVLLTLKNETRAILLKQSMSYDPSLNAWTYAYVMPEDLALGNYTVKVEFRDPHGNKGETEKPIIIKAGYLKVRLTGVDKGGSYERTTTLNISAVVLHTEERIVRSGRFSAIFISPSKVSVLELRYDSLASSWVGSFKISRNETLGLFVLLINGTDKYGNVANYSTWFEVSSAKLNLEPSSPVPQDFQRTQPIELRFHVNYPSGEMLDPDGNVSVSVLHFSGNVSFEWKMNPVYDQNSDEVIWSTSSVKFPADAPLGRYVAKAFAADGNENFGSYQFNLSLIPASLRLNFSANRYSFQVGFEQVVIRGKVLYQDNTELEEGNVSASVKVNSYLRPIIFSYGQDRIWTATLNTSPLDPSGVYKVRITATDRYGNSGEIDLELVGSQLFVTISIIFIVTSVGMVLAFIFRNIQRSRRVAAASESRIFEQR